LSEDWLGHPLVALRIWRNSSAKADALKDNVPKIVVEFLDRALWPEGSYAFRHARRFVPAHGQRNGPRCPPRVDGPARKELNPGPR
jgi:hypothetical protein